MYILKMSLSASVFILAVVIIRSVFINKLPKKTFVILWCTALFLLLIPVSVPSHLSIFSISKQLGITGNAVGKSDKPQTVVYNTPEHDYMDFTEIAVGNKVQPQVNQTEKTDNADITEETQNSKPTIPLVLLIWAAGMAGCVAFFTITHARFRREYSASLPAENADLTKWENQFQRNVRIRISDRISVPLTYGVLRPVILLPKAMDLSDTVKLDFILTHEFAHIRYFDTLKKYLLAAAVSIHWFNPLVWLMYVLANRDIELC